MDGLQTPEGALAAAGARVQTFRPEKPRGRAIGKLRLYSAADAAALPPRIYLLPGLMSPGEFSVWWGAPKCGKSFLLLRIGFGMSLGLGLWGREPGRIIRVLYATAEGEGGFGKRVQALSAELGDPGNAFAFISQRMTLGPPGEHLQDLIEATKIHRAELVIVDTLARTFGEGDENHSGDMGRFISSLDQIREEGRQSEQAPMPHVAVVHHGSKDIEAKMPRGSIALVGGADLVVKVTRGKVGAPSVANVEWAKDDEDGAEMSFRLRKVEAGAGFTCVAEEAEGAAEGTSQGTLPDSAALALRYLADVIGRQGDKLPAGPMFPPHGDLRCVPLAAWRVECRGRALSGSGEKEAEKRAFQRANKTLTAKGYVATGEHAGEALVWIVKGQGT